MLRSTLRNPPMRRYRCAHPQLLPSLWPCSRYSSSSSSSSFDSASTSIINAFLKKNVTAESCKHLMPGSVRRHTDVLPHGMVGRENARLAVTQHLKDAAQNVHENDVDLLLVIATRLQGKTLRKEDASQGKTNPDSNRHDPSKSETLNDVLRRASSLNYFNFRNNCEVKDENHIRQCMNHVSQLPMGFIWESLNIVSPADPQFAFTTLIPKFKSFGISRNSLSEGKLTLWIPLSTVCATVKTTVNLLHPDLFRFLTSRRVLIGLLIDGNCHDNFDRWNCFFRDSFLESWKYSLNEIKENNQINISQTQQQIFEEVSNYDGPMIARCIWNACLEAWECAENDPAKQTSGQVESVLCCRILRKMTKNNEEVKSFVDLADALIEEKIKKLNP